MDPEVIVPKKPTGFSLFQPHMVKAAVFLLIIMLLFTVLRPLVIVPAGHMGVKLNFGAVQQPPLNEGIHFIIPLYQKIVIIDCRVRKAEHNAAAASKDLQTITSMVAVNYHVNQASAADLYQHVGMEYENTVIAPAIQESIKAVTAGYTAEELITKRPEVAIKTSEVLAKKLLDYKIKIDRFNIVNFEFSAEFNKAIEEKQTAEQRALKAQRDLERIKIEAAQKVTQAQAEAEALKIQRQQVTEDLLRLREIENQRLAIEKWNGQLPKVSGGAVPFIDVDKVE
ncbi:MAG: prohibitin family protein [Syntrophomonadaceae bacterium]|nr:prohibitin family protein [Syntrophomonadaceae bacterium]